MGFATPKWGDLRTFAVLVDVMMLLNATGCNFLEEKPCLLGKGGITVTVHEFQDIDGSASFHPQPIPHPLNN
jgi:hypothetical protein